MNTQDKLALTMTNDFREKTWSARESWRVFGIMAEFVEATERLNSIRPAVSIFGSARTLPDHPNYKLTEQIARQFTDRVFHSTWRRDFSQARQHAFDRATGDWVLWVDADDVVLNADRIRESLQRAPAETKAGLSASAARTPLAPTIASLLCPWLS